MSEIVINLRAVDQKRLKGLQERTELDFVQLRSIADRISEYSTA
jgi:hypothetical protein